MPPTLPSRGECCNALSCPPRESFIPTPEENGAFSSYNKQAESGESQLERIMTGQTIDMPRTKRVGLPAIFVAFFRLGVVSFGGGTAGWLYREIVERRRWVNDTEF